MDAGPSKQAEAKAVVSSEAGSGLSINLHPLPILNISEHHTRARLTSQGVPKLFGALLGTQSNRDVSIVNSFELKFVSAGGDDVDMSGSSSAPTAGVSILDVDFLNTRKDQFKQVFPTLDVVGWYSIGPVPSSEDSLIHQQFLEEVDSPLFLLFDPSRDDARDIPITIYEGSFTEGQAAGEVKFVQLGYAIETGEAERIAVDGVSRGGMGQGDESAVVGSLTTQRNAIRMLYERISVLLEYITGVINKTAEPDHTILRQMSSLVATLPTIDSVGFQDEFMTEYSDVQLTKYLTSLTKQLDALADFADMHNVLHPGRGSESFGGDFGGGRGPARVTGGFDFASMGGGPASGRRSRRRG